MHRNRRVCLFGALLALVACGPRAAIPTVPQTVPGIAAADDSVALLARALAPVLYVQPDEPFALERVIAVVHPRHRIIAYHLLWRDDAHGAWIPFTKPVDEEIVWVGYDAAQAPTDLWTYWHGTILHTDWRSKGLPAVDVQWGKHGSLPRATRLTDLPWYQPLDLFFVLVWLGLPDLWLGNLSRPGPWCFCHGYDRYASFTKPIALATRIDIVVRASNPREALRAVFSHAYADKPLWPPGFEEGESS